MKEEVDDFLKIAFKLGEEILDKKHPTDLELEYLNKLDLISNIVKN